MQLASNYRETVVATLGPGGFFGEVGLIFGEVRTADVRTKTYCELVMLAKEDLDEVLEHFPQIQQQFASTCANTEILQKIKDSSANGDKTKQVRYTWRCFGLLGSNI